MLHNSRETAFVWQRVADSLPQLWAVIAPNLHFSEKIIKGNQSEVANLGELISEIIAQDMMALNISEPVVIIASGDAAIVAIHYYRTHPQQVKAIMLTEPQLHVTATQQWLRKIKANFSGVKKKATQANTTQEIEYLTALTRLGKQTLADINVPMRILVAEKERGIMREIKNELQNMKNIEYFPIAGATRGWNEYAPAQYAANIIEFCAVLP